MVTQSTFLEIGTARKTVTNRQALNVAEWIRLKRAIQHVQARGVTVNRYTFGDKRIRREILNSIEIRRRLGFRPSLEQINQACDHYAIPIRRPKPARKCDMCECSPCCCGAY